MTTNLQQIQKILSKQLGLVLSKQVNRPIRYFIVLVMLTSCSTINEPTIDYALEFNFSEIKTFQYLDTPESNAQSEPLNKRIESAIKQQLITSGLQQVETDGDVVVTYHFTREDADSYITAQKELGAYGDWGPGWGRWGYEGPKKWRRWEYTIPRISTTRSYETKYAVGTIIFDTFDPKSKNLVWRGTGLVDAQADPDVQAQQAEKIIDIIGQRWLGILANKEE